jgi:hypothetical protein
MKAMTGCVESFLLRSPRVRDALVDEDRAADNMRSLDERVASISCSAQGSLDIVSATSLQGRYLAPGTKSYEMQSCLPIRMCFTRDLIKIVEAFL